MRALVIGGTGPTGPFIVDGLVRRGYEPVILHRGSHEVDFVRQYEHVHADPHFAQPVTDALVGRRFDLVVVTYGRIRLLAGLLRGVTGRVITVGGTVYARQELSRPATEDAHRDLSHKLVARVHEAEAEVMSQHAEDFRITHLRYPNLYGPRQLAPREWSIIRRIRDNRRTIPVLDGGLTLESRAYVENAAHGVLLAVDQPERSAGQVYHVADAVTPTDAERANAIAAAMGAEVRLVNLPREAGRPAYFWGGGRNLEAMGKEGPPPTHHKLLDSTAIRRDLGYHDLVEFHEAIARTVRWYLRHPLVPGGEDERRIGDPFDYAAEDAFQQALDDFHRRCAEIDFAGVTLRHSYDHPKAPAAAATGTAGDARKLHGPQVTEREA